MVAAAPRRGRVFREFFSGLTVTVLFAVVAFTYDAIEHFDVSQVLVAQSWVAPVSAAVVSAVKAAIGYMLDYLLRTLHTTIRNDESEGESDV